MKPWYLSKTIWFNVGAAVFAFLVTALEPLRVLMSPGAYAIFSTAVGVGNVVLRVITTHGIGKEE